MKSLTLSSFRRLTCLLLVAGLLAGSFNSCMTTKTSVGEYEQQQGQEYKYASGKQFWLFGGLLPLGRTNVATPTDGNCEVITRYNVGDVLINVLTLGILHTYTIKVKAKRVEPVPVAVPTPVN